MGFRRESSHPSEADGKEQKLQQAKWRAEGRINSKNKDIKANYQLFYDSFKGRGPGGKAAAGRGVGSGLGITECSSTIALPVCVVQSTMGTSLARGW